MSRRASSSSSKRVARNAPQPLLDTQQQYLPLAPVVTYEEVQITINIDAEWVDVCRDYPFFNDVCFHVMFPGSVEPVVTPPISSWAYAVSSPPIFPADESPEPSPLHPSLFNPLRKGSYTITLTMTMDLSRIYNIEDIDLTITPFMRTAVLDPAAVASHWHTLTGLHPLLIATAPGIDTKRSRRNNANPNTFASQQSPAGSTAPSRRGRRASLSRVAASQPSPYINPLIPLSLLSAPFTPLPPLSLSLAPLLLSSHHTPTTPAALASTLESLAHREKATLISKYVSAGATAHAAATAAVLELAERKPRRQGTQGGSSGSGINNSSSGNGSSSTSTTTTSTSGNNTGTGPGADGGMADALTTLSTLTYVEEEEKHMLAPPPPPLQLHYHASRPDLLPMPLPLPFSSLSFTVSASAPLLTPQLQALLLPLAVDVEAVDGMQVPSGLVSRPYAHTHVDTDTNVQHTSPENGAGAGVGASMVAGLDMTSSADTGMGAGMCGVPVPLPSIPPSLTYNTHGATLTIPADANPNATTTNSSNGNGSSTNSTAINSSSSGSVNNSGIGSNSGIGAYAVVNANGTSMGAGLDISSLPSLLPAPSSYHAVPHFNTALHAALLTASVTDTAAHTVDGTGKSSTGMSTNMSTGTGKRIEKTSTIDKALIAPTSPLLPAPLSLATLESMGTITHDPLIPSALAAPHTLHTLTRVEGAIPIARQPRVSALVAFFPRLLAKHIASSREAHYARHPPAAAPANTSTSTSTSASAYGSVAGGGGAGVGSVDMGGSGGSGVDSSSSTGANAHGANTNANTGNVNGNINSGGGSGAGNSSSGRTLQDHVSQLVDAAVLRHTLILTRPTPLPAAVPSHTTDSSSTSASTSTSTSTSGSAAAPIASVSLPLTHRHVILLGRLGPHALLSLSREAIATPVPVTIGSPETLTVLARAYAREYGLPVPFQAAMPNLAMVVYEEDVIQAHSAVMRGDVRGKVKKGGMLTSLGAAVGLTSEGGGNGSDGNIGGGSSAGDSTIPTTTSTSTSDSLSKPGLRLSPSSRPPANANTTTGLSTNTAGNSTSTPSASAAAPGVGVGLGIGGTGVVDSSINTVATPTHTLNSASDAHSLSCPLSSSSSCSAPWLAYPSDIDVAASALLSSIYARPHAHAHLHTSTSTSTSASASERVCACGLCVVCVSPLYTRLNTAFTGPQALTLSLTSAPASTSTPAHPHLLTQTHTHTPAQAQVHAHTPSISTSSRLLSSASPASLPPLLSLAQSSLSLASVLSHGATTATFTPVLHTIRTAHPIFAQVNAMNVHATACTATTNTNTAATNMKNTTTTFAPSAYSPLSYISQLLNLLPPPLAHAFNTPLTHVSLAYLSLPTVATWLARTLANAALSSPSATSSASTPSSTPASTSAPGAGAMLMVSSVPSATSCSSSFRSHSLPPPSTLMSSLAARAPHLSSLLPSHVPRPAPGSTPTPRALTPAHTRTHTDLSPSYLSSSPHVSPIALITPLYTYIRVTLKPSQPLPLLPSPLLPLPPSATTDPTISLTSAVSPYLLSPIHRPLCTHALTVCSCPTCTAPVRPPLSYPDPTHALFPTADITISHVAHAVSDAIRASLHAGLALREGTGTGNGNGSGVGVGIGSGTNGGMGTSMLPSSPSPSSPSSSCALRLCTAASALTAATLAPLTSRWRGAWLPPLAPSLLALLQALGANAPFIPLFMAHSTAATDALVPSTPLSPSRPTSRPSALPPATTTIDTTVFSSRKLTLPSIDASFVLSPSTASVDSGFARTVFRVASRSVATAILARVSAHNAAITSVLRSLPPATATIPDYITGLCLADPTGVLLVLEAPIPPSTLHSRLGLTPSSLFTSIFGPTHLLAPPLSLPSSPPCLCPVLAPIPAILASTNPHRYTIDPTSVPATTTIAPISLLLTLTASIHAQVTAGALNDLFALTPTPTHLSIAAPCLTCNTPMSSSHVFVPTLTAAKTQCDWCLLLSQLMLLASLLFVSNPQISPPSGAAPPNPSGKTRGNLPTSTNSWNWFSPTLSLHSSSAAIVNATTGLFFSRLHAWARAAVEQPESIDSNGITSNFIPSHASTSTSASSRSGSGNGTSINDTKSSKIATVSPPPPSPLTTDTVTALLSTFTTPSEAERDNMARPSVSSTSTSTTASTSTSTSTTTAITGVGVCPGIGSVPPDTADTCLITSIIAQSPLFSSLASDTLTFTLPDSSSHILTQYVTNTVQSHFPESAHTLSALASLAETLLPTGLTSAMPSSSSATSPQPHSSTSITTQDKGTVSSSTSPTSRTSPSRTTRDGKIASDTTQLLNTTQRPETSLHSENTAIQRQEALSHFLLHSITTDAEPLLILLSLASLHKLHDHNTLTPLPGIPESTNPPEFSTFSQSHFPSSASAAHNLADVTALHSYNAMLYSIGHPVRAKETGSETHIHAANGSVPNTTTAAAATMSKGAAMGRGMGTSASARCHTDSPLCLLPSLLAALSTRLLTIATNTLTDTLISYLSTPLLPTSSTSTSTSTSASTSAPSSGKTGKGRRAANNKALAAASAAVTAEHDLLMQAIDTARVAPLPFTPDAQTLAAAKRARTQAATPAPTHTYVTTGFGLHLLLELVKETNEVGVEALQRELRDREVRESADRGEYMSQSEIHIGKFHGKTTLSGLNNSNSGFNGMNSTMTRRGTLANHIDTHTQKNPYTASNSSVSGYNKDAVYGSSATWRQATAVYDHYTASCQPITVTQRDIAFGRPVTHTTTIVPAPTPPSASQRHPAELTPACTVAYISKYVYNTRVSPLPSSRMLTARTSDVEEDAVITRTRTRTRTSVSPVGERYGDVGYIGDVSPLSIMQGLPTLRQASYNDAVDDTTQCLVGTTQRLTSAAQRPRDTTRRLANTTQRSTSCHTYDASLHAPGLETVSLPTRIGLLLDRVHAHRHMASQNMLMPKVDIRAGSAYKGSGKAGKGDGEGEGSPSAQTGTSTGRGVDMGEDDPSAGSRAHFANLFHSSVNRTPPTTVVEAGNAVETDGSGVDAVVFDNRSSGMGMSGTTGNGLKTTTHHSNIPTTAIALRNHRSTDMSSASVLLSVIDQLIPPAFADAAAFLSEIEKTTLEVADELIVPLAMGRPIANSSRLLDKRTKFTAESCTCIRSAECRCYEIAIVDAVVKMPRSEVLREISAFMQ